MRRRFLSSFNLYCSSFRVRYTSQICNCEKIVGICKITVLKLLFNEVWRSSISKSQIILKMRGPGFESWLWLQIFPYHHLPVGRLSTNLCLVRRKSVTVNLIMYYNELVDYLVVIFEGFEDHINEVRSCWLANDVGGSISNWNFCRWRIIGPGLFWKWIACSKRRSWYALGALSTSCWMCYAATRGQDRTSLSLWTPVLRTTRYTWKVGPEFNLGNLYSTFRHQGHLAQLNPQLNPTRPQQIWGEETCYHPWKN